MRVLKRVSFIYYPVQFRKDKGKNILALLNFGNNVNAMTLAYAAHLGLKVRVTNISTQKIDGSSLVTYGIVIAIFQVVNKLGCFWFFPETFLLADISMKVVLVMPSLPLIILTYNLLKKSLLRKLTLPKKPF